MQHAHCIAHVKKMLLGLAELCFVEGCVVLRCSVYAAFESAGQSSSVVYTTMCVHLPVSISAMQGKESLTTVSVT